MSTINKCNCFFQDEVRTQKETKQKGTLEAVSNSVKLLNEMLAHFSPEDSTDGDKELIRVSSPSDKAHMTFSNNFAYVFGINCPFWKQTHTAPKAARSNLLWFHLTLWEAMKTASFRPVVH